MFYDINVMNSRTLGAAWRIAHQMPADTSNVGLTKICSSLNKNLENRSVSLRTSSVLVNGAARAYKEEAAELYRDCTELNIEMIGRNRSSTEIIDSDSNSTEESSRTINRNSKSKGNYSNRKRNNSYPKQRSRSERNGKNGLENDLSQADKTNVSKSSITTIREIGVQTMRSYLSNKRKKCCQNKPNDDENQSFGLVMVCDTASRIPKKIICSNINMNTL